MSIEQHSRILVIDDNEQNVALLRAQLELAHYVVRCASNGADGLALATDEPPDLILSDVMMPGLDGYEVCRRLKAGETTRTVPVILLTALQERTEKIRGLEAGADDFLTKPVDRVELLVRVRSLLRMKRLYDELAQSRDELAREHQTLMAVTASMADGLIVVDGTGRVTDYNQRVTEFFGLPTFALEPNAISQDGLVQVLAERLVEPETLTAFMVEVLAAPEREHMLNAEIVHPARRDVKIIVFPILGRDGQPLGRGILVQDISVEREMARTKDKILSVVSHELRSPMTAIFGYAELLVLRLIPAERLDETYQTIYDEAQRLANLLDDFLDLQRLESGRAALRLESVSFPQLVQRAFANLAPQCTTRHRLIPDFPPEFPMVSVDRDRMYQVLTNLVGNAIKYSPTGGEIRVSAQVEADEFVVTVRDQGLGLPAHAIPQLFEKFFRVDMSDRREIGGTGLGLAIVREIVEQHQGRIWAESLGPGKGSTFGFALPHPRDRNGEVS